MESSSNTQLMTREFTGNAHCVKFELLSKTTKKTRGDEFASKASNNESRSIVELKNCGIEDLGFPMFCLIDYIGFRLIAQTQLPISESTLIYGSKNNGAEVFASNPDLNKKMRAAANKLNLKAHHTGVSAKGRQLLYFPGDIEGHKGTDNKFYVIDTARVFPPEAPVNFFHALFINSLETGRFCFSFDSI